MTNQQRLGRRIDAVRRVILAVVAVALAVLALVGCAPGGGGDGGRPQIVVTTNILGDVVQNVIGDQADVTVLMKRNADPHSFEVSAKEAADMQEADLLVSNGLGLEESLGQHFERAGSAGVEHFVAAEAIEPLDYESGEAAGVPDPHFWTDPETMIDVVSALEESLAQLPGVDAGQVSAAAETYRDDLVDLDATMRAQFATIPPQRRALVTNHHVFGYLAEAYDFRLIGAVIPGGSTLASPSAADLEELSGAIEEAGVPAIFAESSQPDRLVTVLADEAGIEVAVVELITESLTEAGAGGGTYLEMMRTNTTRITEGLTA
ncbi:zinc ABC transporter substrate-binding protein AztC [Zhihengliuella salsuginis]|uniref:ABC transporter substrate-binding protein n=1 Tax=Zhihengliuella salsuginis TaxID=578222 RepID=A0ABQ3GJ40_9MICC|nr:zinc ABC transporter substrate-binding protein AztC [Zhihengliuella salsuginis]GHD05594.1 ABC transporter substrate-binding protein [Zhihengliuella salsuginis]